jgi:hypothetical protein
MIKTTRPQSMVLAATPTVHMRDARISGRCRSGYVAAYLAAPLWALQSVIWIAAPKVQEQSAPFRITSALLFELFWMSIAGAVAFSAASARQITATNTAPRSRLCGWSRILGAVALFLAAAATVCIAVAPLPAVQSIAIAAMTNLLNAAMVLLAGSLTLAAIVSRGHNSGLSLLTALPTCLAAVTIGMIVAIFASRTHSMVGLIFAVAVAILSGVTWLLWGRASSAAVRQDGRRH